MTAITDPQATADQLAVDTAVSAEFPRVSGLVTDRPSHVTMAGEIVVGMDPPMGVLVSRADRAWMEQVVQRYEQVQRARLLP
jgi:predicted RNA methylase